MQCAEFVLDLVCAFPRASINDSQLLMRVIEGIRSPIITSMTLNFTAGPGVVVHSRRREGHKKPNRTFHPDLQHGGKAVIADASVWPFIIVANEQLNMCLVMLLQLQVIAIMPHMRWPVMNMRA
jgi:hypothetical protein